MLLMLNEITGKTILCIILNNCVIKIHKTPIKFLPYSIFMQN